MKLYKADVNGIAFSFMIIWMFFVAGGIAGAIAWAIYLKFAMVEGVENATVRMVVSGIGISLAMVVIFIVVFGAMK